jgi:hypothetical protein
VSTKEFLAIRSKVLLTILATMGWLVWILYWVALVWSRRTLLQSGAILMLSLLAYSAGVVVLFPVGRSDEGCQGAAKSAQRSRTGGLT